MRLSHVEHGEAICGSSPSMSKSALSRKVFHLEEVKIVII
jgi:hypothetical protein